MMNFKEFILKEEESENSVKTLLDAQDLIFFFKKGKEIFGANEESRLVFAKLKEKKEENKKWQNEASFLAINLTKAVQGENSKSVFSKKDLNQMSIINKEDAFKALCKEAKKSKKLIKYDKICLGTDKFNSGINNVPISDEG